MITSVVLRMTGRTPFNRFSAIRRRTPAVGTPQSQRTADGAGTAAGGRRQAWIWRAEDGALAKRQCSVMAALETAAHPHHTEAKPETVSRAMMTTAIRLTTPNSTTLR
jgi:hypothetical protein